MQSIYEAHLGVPPTKSITSLFMKSGGHDKGKHHEQPQMMEEEKMKRREGQFGKESTTQHGPTHRHVAGSIIDFHY
ncbi:kinetochore scaffold 1 [Sesbania bispinosa]|nr:kinetochore scaffold 1 [Sesbania bispinosa]